MNLFAKTFVIEGPDKMGKATQSKMLVNSLRAEQGNKTKVTLVEVPFNDRLTHRVIYWMLRNGLAKKAPNLFQFVQFLNKFFFQIFVLPYLLLTNDYVVFDRWSLSAIVYGGATGVNKNFNEFLYSLLYKPNGTVVLTGRPHFRKGSDSYESDNDLQSTVRELYSLTADQLPYHGKVDANQGREKVHSEVLDYFDIFCRTGV